MTSGIAIIGGGIGGLSTAISLQHAGFDCVVYERSAELREVGAAISIWANAMTVLRKLGVAERVIASGSVIREAALRNWNGECLLAVPSLPHTESSICIHRADLQRTLAEALTPGTLRLGKVFEGFTEERDGITVRFEGGSEEKASLLIGADGLNSRVRAELLGDGPSVYRGYQCWRGISPQATTAEVSENYGAGVRVGIIPIGARGTAWWITYSGPEQSRDYASREFVMGLVKGWYSPIPEILASTADFIPTPIYDRPPTRTWHKGRVLLLGDAAHPTTPNLGQGGCMAIEDALILTRCLSAAPDHERAFEMFFRARYARTTRVTRESLRMGAIGQWRNPLLCGIRSLLFRNISSNLLMKSVMALLDYDASQVSLLPSS